MSENQPERQRWIELWEMDALGDLSPDARKELQELLERSREARLLFAELYREESGLARELGRPIPTVPDFPSAGADEDQGSRWAGILALAAAIALVWVFLSFGSRAPSTPSADMQAEGVGTPSSRMEETLALAGLRLKPGPLATYRMTSEGPGKSGAATHSIRPRLELTSGQFEVEFLSASGAPRITIPGGYLSGDVGSLVELEIKGAQGKREEMTSREESLKKENSVKPGELKLWTGFSATVTALVILGAAEYQPLAMNAAPLQLLPEAGKVALSQDGSLGKIVDREGIGQVKRIGDRRFHGVEENDRVQPGDWIQTGTRGANALVVQLQNDIRLILGPATQVEVQELGRLKLLRGELFVACPENVQLAMTTHDGVQGEETTVLQGEKTIRAGSKGLLILSEEPRWLAGYLGDEVTDAMGSLLANVDGRDVPLTLAEHRVHVDIRDQVARTRIVESFVNHTTSVLEGVFYFPLPADASISGFAMWIGNEKIHGEIVEKQRAREIYETILREKRDPGLLEWSGGNIFKARVYPIVHRKKIEITYTQVLPKVGPTYSYHCALRSELTRLRPLSHLSLEVNVNSERGLAEITCPTHPARIQQTDHSARIEFSMQDHTPRRDFEVRVRTVEAENPLSMVSHRRGNDGYFMVAVEGPEVAKTDDSEGTPLDILMMVDTSGSITEDARVAQIAFVEALLTGLSEDDRMNLMTVDHQVRYVFQGPVLATRENVATALTFLEVREPLGWTDLEASFTDAFTRCGEETQVIYVGDGVKTRGELDPATFARWLVRSYDGRGVFHGVVPGSSQEPIVLSALSSLGGGSYRSLGAGTDASRAADGLLREMTTEGMKDLSVRFEGANVAAIYPERIPNLMAGSQIMVVGRYYGGEEKVAGTVIASGSVGGKRQEWSLPFEFAANEEGNSFIPRLWARRHLDHLLAQGVSDEMQQTIVRFSENYQIITPYTSFLVLETEEDRERFKVRKRFRMRDGEEFFARGREDADFELSRKQMLAAKTWRQGLQETVLSGLATFSRELTESLGQSGQAVPGGRGESLSWGQGGGGPVGGARLRLGERKLGLTAGSEFESEVALREVARDVREFDLGDDSRPVDAPASSSLLGKRLKASSPSRLRSSLSRRGRYEDGYFSDFGRGKWDKAGERRGVFPDSAARLERLFPALHAPNPGPEDPDCSEQILFHLRSIDRRETIKSLVGGVRFTVSRSNLDRQTGRTSRIQWQSLLSSTKWWTRYQSGVGEEILHNWCAGGKRSVLHESFGLGRTRPVKEGDLTSYSPPWPELFYRPGEWIRNGTTTVQEQGEEMILITVSSRMPSTTRTELLIDSKRSVLLKATWFSSDAIQRSVVFSDFLAVRGTHWPTTMREFDGKGNEISFNRAEIESLSGNDLSGAFDELEKIEKKSSLLPESKMTVDEAKIAVTEGNGSLVQYWKLLVWEVSRDRWDLADVHLEPVLSALSDKWTRDRVGFEILFLRRRNEEGREKILSMAKDLAASPRDTDSACAGYLYASGGPLAPAELFELVQLLRPVYERIERTLPLYAHDSQILECLSAMHRQKDAFEKLLSMTIAYPDSVSHLLRLGREMARFGRVDEALALLTQRQDKPGIWRKQQVQQLRSAHLSLLFDSHRLRDVISVVESWQQKDPDGVLWSWLDRMLHALYLLGRVEEAEEKIDAWLRPENLGEANHLTLSRLEAAKAHGLGYGSSMYRRRTPEKWTPLLTDLVRNSLFTSKYREIALSIVGNWRLRRTEEGRRLLDELFTRFATGVDSLTLEEIGRFFAALRRGDHKSDLATATYEGLVSRVVSRWERSNERAPADLLEMIRWIQSSDLELRYHRVLLAKGRHPEGKIGPRSDLFGLLLKSSWSETKEQELLALLPQLQWKKDYRPIHEKEIPSKDLAAKVQGAYSLVNWMIDARADAGVAAHSNVNLLSRRKRTALREAERRKAREATVMILTDLEQTLEPESLRPWMSLDRLGLQIRSGGDVKKAGMEVMNLRAAFRKKKEAESETGSLLDDIFVTRLTAMAAYLGTLPEGEDIHSSLYGVLLAEEKDPSTRSKAREWLVRILVAQDEGAEVSRFLKAWFEDQEAGLARWNWGRHHARVLAEQGEFQAAIQVLEEVEKIDSLDPQDYRSLAAWAKVLGEKNRAKEAKILALQTEREYDLTQRIQRELRNSESGGELSEDTGGMFVALFRSAQSPENHVNLLKNCYSSTRDFRLLSALAEGVMGQTNQQIYFLLTGIRRVTDLLQEEATLDRLVGEIESLLAGEDLTSTDRRALDLLRFMVTKKAVSQGHGTKFHVEDVLESLRSAFKGEWAMNERKLMAELLASLGQIKSQPVTDEVLRQVGSLRDGAERSSRERMDISLQLATLQWNNDKKSDAVRLLRGSLTEFAPLYRETVRERDDSLLSRCISYLSSLGHFIEAEGILQEEVRATDLLERRWWLQEKLYGLYRDALLGSGETSLGSGKELYAGVRDLIVEDLLTRTNEVHVVQGVDLLCSIFEVGKRRTELLSMIRPDASEFGFSTFPRVLALYQHRGAKKMVGRVVTSLDRMVSTNHAMLFLIARGENEPAWLSIMGQGFWQQHSGWLASNRVAASLDHSGESRLLALVSEEIRRDLRTRTSLRKSIYHDNYSVFWREKKEEFGRIALSIAKERNRDQEVVLYVAKYLTHGLGMKEEAAVILLDSYRRGGMSLAGRYELCSVLHLLRRHEESLPILREMVKVAPTNLDYRSFYMQAFYEMGQVSELHAERRKAESDLRAEDKWKESEIKTLGWICLQTKMFQDCVDLLNEAIALNKSGISSQGRSGSQRLAEYYSMQASAFEGLGLTIQAIDAVSGSIVSSAGNRGHLDSSIGELDRLLKRTKNLAVVDKFLDEELKRTGIINPILRKSVGRAWLERERGDLAAAHLDLALESQPNDTETLRLVVEAYDKAGEGEIGSKRLLTAARTEGRNTDLFKRLGDRYKRLSLDVRAERAYTNIVEALPEEAASHLLLAQIRESARRLDEAARHYLEVIRIRSNEPGGYQGLLQVLVKQKKWDEARELIRKIRSRTFPKRFTEVESTIQGIEKEIPKE